MGKSLKVKRRYFTKAQKISILNELNIKGVSLSELARKYQMYTLRSEFTKQAVSFVLISHKGYIRQALREVCENYSNPPIHEVYH